MKQAWKSSSPKSSTFMLPAKLYEDKDERERHVTPWNWFLKHNSIGGLAQYKNTDLKSFKIVWLSLLTVGTFGTIFNLKLVIQDFAKYDVITTITKHMLDELSFPSVTLCNNNPVHCGNLYDHILSKMNKNSKTIKNLCEIYNFGKCHNSIKVELTITQGEANITEICKRFNQMDVRDISDIKESDGNMLETMLDKLAPEDRYAIAHQSHQIFRKCRFNFKNGKNCQALTQGKHKLISPSAGVCYTFNYMNPNKQQKGQTLVPATYGDEFGLELEIDLQSGHNLGRGLTSTAGVKLLLHKPGEYPMISTRGISIGPNTETKIVFEPEEIHREPSPYPSKCQNSWHENTIGLEKVKSPYQSLLCQNFCYDDFVLKTCNCSIGKLSEMNRNLGPVCDLQNPKHFECLEEYIERPLKLTSKVKQACQHCNPQCFETTYKITNSQATWPTHMYLPVLARQYNIHFNGTNLNDIPLHMSDISDYFANSLSDYLYHKDVMIVNMMEKYVRRSFLKVQIFHQSSSMTVMRESRKYTWDGFLSSIGGALSLYLGITVVSFFEFGEFIARLLLHFCAK